MSTKFQRSPLSNSNSNSGDRQSLFFRDLASPISHHRTSRFAAAGAGNHHHSATFSSWRENLADSDSPPPPPVFTLEDRVEFSPEPALLQEPAQDPKTPSPVRNESWWSPRKREEEEMEGEKGSPLDGVVTSSSSRALVVLPQVKEVAKAEIGRREDGGRFQGVVVNEEEWVTVYGFSPGDTNLVLREFEKCGEILKHVPGPRDANWMHILYQNRYDAQKALGKNGMQLNSALIVGVKPVDPVQRQYLNEKLNNTHRGFMTSLPPQFTAGRSSTAPPRPSCQPNARIIVRDGGPRSARAIASPEKSVLSKVMDLMFGF